MKSPLLFACTVEISGDTLQDDDIVLFDDVGHSALDICQAFFDEGRFDILSLYRGQGELFKFVRIFARTGPDPNDFIKYVNCGDRDHSLFLFLKSGE